MLPAIVLVRPQMGENIGAAARVMANFGLKELRIVAPRDGWPNSAAEDMSAGALGMLEVSVFDGLEKALADRHYVLATSARRRDLQKPVVTLPRVPEILAEKSAKTAILFGAERSGLSNEELCLADALVSVPVDEAFPSLNLAQAVAVVAYECVRGGALLLPKESESSPATKDEIHGLYEHLEEVLDQRGFFPVAEKRPKMVQNIRAVFARADMTQQEVQTLRGIVRYLGERKSESD